MDNINYVLYLCFFIPMVMSFLVLERRARLVVGYILIGTTVCLFVSEVNGALFELIGRNDLLYFCTTISPITEEFVKALPILFYAFFVSNNRIKIVQIAFSLGLGFAILENMIMLTQNLSDIDVAWSLVRGFGAGLMHSVCTMTVGMGFSFIRRRRKLFYSGTISLLMLAITYHAIYNTIVMSSFKYLGFALPLSTYIPIIVFERKKRKKALAAKKEKTAVI